MERNINVAKILKSKSKGTKLYSSAFGQMTYNGIAYDINGTEIWLLTENKVDTLYLSDGKYREGGEVTLYPSKEMRDWNKFAWKKGDVLVSNDYGTEVIFYDWYDDTYTNFYGKHYLNSEDKNNIKYNDTFLCTTGRYSLEDKDAAQTYINTIEERLGGKLNRETLEIEKQTEFKDGDIAFADYGNGQDVFIVSDETDLSEGYNSFISLDLSNLTLSMGCRTSFFKKDLCELRLATEAEKQQLLLALENKGKAWDAKKKEVVDLKPKIELKPFDKVLVRDGKDEIWEPAFFFRNLPKHNVYKYQTVGGKLRVYCIPFNKETAKLIGTSNDWEG